MRIVAVFLIAAAICLPYASAKSQTSSAEAPSVEDLFRQFGLFGTWALNCDRPAAPSNPYVRIAEAADGPVEEHDLGLDFTANRYRVVSAERVAAERLKVVVTFQPGTAAEQRQTLVLRIAGGTRRTLFNQPDGGPVRVKDGIVIANGAKTATLRKCE